MKRVISLTLCAAGLGLSALASFGCSLTLDTDSSLRPAEQIDSITIERGVFTPEFSPDVLTYDVDIPFGFADAGLTVEAFDSFTITVNGEVYTPGAAMAMTFPLGDTEVKVDVASPNASVSYQLNIHRTLELKQYMHPVDGVGLNFGESFAMTDNFLAIGADGGSGNEERVYVYTRDPVFGWKSPPQIIIPPEAAANDFGQAIAMNDSVLVVGAPDTDTDGIADNSSEGRVYLYNLVDGVWTFDKSIQQSGTQQDFADYGYALSLDGNLLAIGAPFDAGGGAAFIYDLTTEAQVRYSDPDADDFGESVSLVGTTLFVGAPNTDINGGDAGSSHGRVFGYQHPQTVNFLEGAAQLVPDAPASGDDFGDSVFFTGTRLFVGAPLDDSSAAGATGPLDEDLGASGGVYVYDVSGTTVTRAGFLKHNDPGTSDQFGESIFALGDFVVVGALFESGAGEGVNPAHNDDELFSGAAYVFGEQADGSYAQAFYLKGVAMDSFDDMGFWVAATPTSLVVGSPFEEGPDNQAANSTGAVYVFE